MRDFHDKKDKMNSYFGFLIKELEDKEDLNEGTALRINVWPRDNR